MTNKNEEERALVKEKRQFVGPVLGFVAGLATAALGFVSGVLDREVEYRQVDVEVMRIAFDVLQLPKEQTGPTYRTWACGVLNIHTKTSLNCSAEDVSNAVLGDLARFRDLGVGDRDEGAPSNTDIGLYICESSDERLAQLAASALRQAGFGDIALRRWNLFEEISRADLSNKVTVVYDSGHPEASEIERISNALSDPSFGQIVTQENAGGVTGWFISIIVCDK